MIDSRIRGLYENERQEAWNKARDATAGLVPNPKLFQRDAPHPYPPVFVSLVITLCLVVFGAAFVPSAYRLSTAGSREFCLSLTGSPEAASNDPRCQNVGVATVLLAEIGQAVFVLALAVLPTSESVRLGRVSVRPTNALLYGGALASTVLAIAGNAHISRPWDYGNYLFDYLMTFVPPLLVMAVGYVLKEVMVTYVKKRHEGHFLYNKAVEEHALRLESPQDHPAWLRHYTQTLRDSIRKANARQKDLLSALSRDEWEYLIRREMLAGQWEVNPDRPTWLEVLPPSPDSVPKLETGNDEIWFENGSWTARSRTSGQVLGTTYRHEGHARNALRNHHRALERAEKGKLENS